MNRKRKARGAAINIGSGWFRRGRRKGNLVASSPVSRCHLCVLDSWLRASSRPPPTKGGGGTMKERRERERKGGLVVPRFYLVSRSAIDRRQATVARSHRALKAKIKLLESGGIRRRPAARSVVPAGRCKRPRSSTSPAFLSLSLFPRLLPRRWMAAF